jgi:hypothetical protein
MHSIVAVNSAMIGSLSGPRCHLLLKFVETIKGYVPRGRVYTACNYICGWSVRQIGSEILSHGGPLARLNRLVCQSTIFAPLLECMGVSNGVRSEACVSCFAKFSIESRVYATSVQRICNCEANVHRYGSPAF